MEVGKAIKLKETESRNFMNIGQKNSVIEGLESNLGLMVLKKHEIDDEVRILKQRNQDPEMGIGNGVEEEDRVTQLMIENKVLKCEKKRAESEVEDWKVKCKELEMKVMELEKRLSAAGPSVLQTDTEIKGKEDKDVSGTPSIDIPSEQCTDAGGFRGGRQCELKARARKRLDFAAEGSRHSHISPSTPGGRLPFGPIDISDSDDDNTTRMHLPDLDGKEGKNVCSSTDVAVGITPGEKELILRDGCTAVVEHEGDEEETIGHTGRLPYRPTPKRRRVSKGVAYIVSSESESDADDDVPICKLRSKHLLACTPDDLSNRRSMNDSCSGDGHKELTPRRRLMRVGDCDNKDALGEFCYKTTGSQNNIGITGTMHNTVHEDEMREDVSCSEGESLGGFIVNSSDVSESDSASNCNGTSDNHVSEIDGAVSGDGSGDSAEYTSENSMGYDEVIAVLRRERKDKMKWGNEGEMLADFGKRTELCMKAVCTLYRQQTSEEKSCKATIDYNRRGFSQIHASVGSDLAEFLTDGDPQGDVKKSVEELQEFDAEGLKQCWKLATHYSKQLFEIYENGEDPFFHP